MQAAPDKNSVPLRVTRLHRCRCLHHVRITDTRANEWPRPLPHSPDNADVIASAIQLEWSRIERDQRTWDEVAGPHPKVLDADIDRGDVDDALVIEIVLDQREHRSAVR